MMQTYYAPAERLEGGVLHRDIECVVHSPVISTLLKFSYGILAILNEERQILALNATFLDMLGIEDPADILGLRPGEVLQCIHAHEMEGGCGTSEYCSSCGAAISMVASLKTEQPVKRLCALVIEKGNKKQEMLLAVRCQRIVIGKRTYLTLFLTDITHEHQSVILERVFFHDMNNIVSAILGSSELLSKDPEYNYELISGIYTSSMLLAREIAIQRSILNKGVSGYRPELSQMPVKRIIGDIRDLFFAHPLTRDREIVLPVIGARLSLITDRPLLVRILVNMITNALEATEPKGSVTLSVEQVSKSISFVVWNKASIPKNIQKRIFQRNFSTRPEAGRGLGTYSMKYIGEQLLGGNVGFSSSESDGTRFWLTLNPRGFRT